MIHLKLNHRSVFLRRPNFPDSDVGINLPTRTLVFQILTSGIKIAEKFSFCCSKLISLECFHLELWLLFVICLVVEEKLGV